MAQVSYGTITIIDTNDIESITIEYARNQDPLTAPTSGWDTTRPTWAQGYYIWQRTRVHKTGTDTSTDTFGDAVCLTGSTGQTGSAGQSLTATKTQYTHVASNVTITTSNHTSYTWTDNVPEYDSTKPVYWGRITNTYTNPAKTEYLVYKDNGLTDAIAQSVEANANASDALDKANEAESIAQQTIEDAQGAMSQAASNLNSVVRLWYAKANSTAPTAPTSGITTGSTSTYNAWSTVKPADNSNYQYYFYCDQSRTGGGVYSWSSVTLDTSTLSQYQIGALTTKVKNFWWDSNGAHVASGKNGNEVTTNTISTYGYHALMGLTGISFNYDSAKVVDLNSTTPSLDFYQPPTISGSTVTQGKKTMMLSANALRFYDPTDGTTEQAVLDTNGLILKKGGVKAGTFNDQGNSNHFIYLSTEDYGTSITINGHSASNWREIIGTKFGVDNEGNLYADGANIINIAADNITAETLSAITADMGTLTAGTISYGPTGSNNTIYLSANSSKTATIAGESRENLRFTVGRNFGVNSDGILYATGADIAGVIKANTGYIGGTSGWTIATQQISSGSIGTDNSMFLSTKNLAGTVAGKTLTTTAPSWRLTVGSGFGVTNTGKLYATGADITGAVTASSLTIQEQATIVDDDGLIDNGALPIEDLESGIKTATESSNDNLKYLMSIYVEGYTSNMIDPTDPDGQAILPLPKLNGEIDERKESSLINRNLVLINDSGISIRGISAEQTTSLNITSTDMQFTTSSGTPILTIHAEEEQTSYIDADMGQFEFVNMQNGECNLTWVARSNGHLTLKEV